jgi:hypothetical protein
MVVMHGWARQQHNKRSAAFNLAGTVHCANIPFDQALITVTASTKIPLADTHAA